jgi:hypothetical protein
MVGLQVMQKILLFIDESSETSFNRLDLIKEVLNLDYTYNRLVNRGTMCNIFATMRANKILSYSTADRTWSKGSNFENYISEYLSGYRA